MAQASGHKRRLIHRCWQSIGCASLVLSAGIASHYPSQAFAQAPASIQIGTGGAAGVYFVAGNAICRMVRIESRKSPGSRLRCAAPPSGGSIDNLDRLSDKSIDFAIVQSDWQHHAYRGTSRFKGAARKNLRSVFSLHVEPFQVVTRAGAGIRRWNDLADKRINIGNPGSGHRATFEELVRVHGQSMSRFAEITSLASSDQATAFCDGKVDAFVFTVGVPNASIAQATDGCDGSIISLETPAVGKLIRSAGYYRWATIPEGTYFTSTATVRTIGVMATLITRADVSDATVAHVTKAVFENFNRFRRLHPAFEQLKEREMAHFGLSAPLHPAAQAYFRSVKLSK